MYNNESFESRIFENESFECRDFVMVGGETDENSQTQNGILYRGAKRIGRSGGRGRKLAKKFLSLVLSAAIFGSVAGGAFFGVNTALGNNTATTSLLGTTSSVVATLTSSSNSGSLDVSAIASAGLNSVVAVTNTSVQEVQSYFSMFGRGGFGQTQIEESVSCGSGVIIYADDTNLYMVTNYHVIEDATTLSITFVDDSTYEAEVCGYDADVDLAVIKVSLSDITEYTLSQISIATVGSSDDLAVGEQVVAIGNALGYGQSVTTGIVSALNRSLSTDSTAVAYIQTDAAINPGNSGGALFNMNGELIGINTAKIASSEVEGMGYAIPISQVLELIQSMIEG